MCNFDCLLTAFYGKAAAVAVFLWYLEWRQRLQVYVIMAGNIRGKSSVWTRCVNAVSNRAALTAGVTKCWVCSTLTMVISPLLLCRPRNCERLHEWPLCGCCCAEERALFKCTQVLCCFYLSGFNKHCSRKTNICIAYTIFNHSQSGLVTVPFTMRAQVIDIRPQNYTYSAVSCLPLSRVCSSKDISADGSENASLISCRSIQAVNPVESGAWGFLTIVCQRHYRSISRHLYI